MDSNEILKADLLDIVFDNRNKQYGAYTLRKFYPSRVKTSLLIAFFSIGVVLYLIGSGKAKQMGNVENDIVHISQIVIPAETPKKIIIPPVQKPRTVAAPRAQERFITRIEVVDNTTQTLADIHDLEHRMISDETRVGPPATGINLPLSNITGQGNGTPTPNTEAEPELLPSREPEFPGGARAWLAFLNRHLAVPGELEAGEKKTVVIRFQVSVDGEVTGFTVVESPGKIYESEVIRVLRKMPRWKPAVQNGIAVARSFTQPVTFMGVE